MDFASVYGRLVDPDLIDLAHYCETLAGGQDLAPWKSFRPEAVPAMMGRLYVAEVVDGGADYFIRLSGMLMREIYGSDLEGLKVSVIADAGLRRILKKNFDAIVECREPLLCHGRLCWPDGHCIAVNRLLIPFAGPDGQLRIILGAIHCDAPLDLLVLFRGKGPAVFTPMACEEAQPI